MTIAIESKTAAEMIKAANLEIELMNQNIAAGGYDGDPWPNVETIEEIADYELPQVRACALDAWATAQGWTSRIESASNTTTSTYRALHREIETGDDYPVEMEVRIRLADHANKRPGCAAHINQAPGARSFMDTLAMVQSARFKNPEAASEEGYSDDLVFET